ncbi:gamma-glutamylcyclotransferase family protein [Streptomyces sp. NPDC048290]|uniref:gamma-glutamylcyclotransferase family protein n=1 Tax=Streptomyces sp. NPDC048290 TaxID=3155811 RepID=UPI003441B1A4
MTLPFFVYGTLRPGESNHAAYLRGRTHTEHPARLPGAVLYDGPGYPYAVPAPGGIVHGELITALPDAYPQLLHALDELEEYIPGDPRSLYERVSREVVQDPAGTPVDAWVYLAAPTIAARLRTHGTLIPGGDWCTRTRR